MTRWMRKLLKNRKGVSHAISIVLAVAATVGIITTVVLAFRGMIPTGGPIQADFALMDAPAPVSVSGKPAFIISYVKGPTLDMNQTYLTIMDADGILKVNRKSIYNISSDTTNFTFVDSDNDKAFSPGDQIIVKTDVIGAKSEPYTVIITTKGQTIYHGTITPT